MPLHKIPKRELKIFDIDEITIEQSLDKKENGAYGEIHYGIINSTNTPIALKKFKEDFSMQILDKDVTKEIIILQLLNQFPETNTVQLYGICFNDNGKNCFLVLERLETTLHTITIRVKQDVLKNKGRLNAEQYKIIFYKLLKSINAIHSLGFVHNDIKLPNLMLNGNDIKFIDFGLAKFIGLSPLTNQIRTYNTTEIIKAPDSRMSFSTDIFSLASTMVHMCIRDYRRLGIYKDSFDNYGIRDVEDNTPLSSYLSGQYKFGIDGHDLLLILLDKNVERRWCASKALLHPYFDSLRLIENIQVDRTVVGLSGGINGLMRHTEYNEELLRDKSLELCYFEEMFNNYKDVLCPIKQITTNIEQYHILINWILEKFNDSRDVTRLFYGIDTIINGIIMTNNNINTYTTSRKPLIAPIINPDFIYTSFNMMLFQDITSERRIDLQYMLEGRVSESEITTLFYHYLNDINIDFYPISIHISYIYLQLAHELKSITSSSSKTTKFNKAFFIDLCVQIIIWFIQPIPFEKDITISDVVIFSTIKLLSNILPTTHVLLIETPIIPILTMDLVKYEEMLSYYAVQYQSMEFDKYPQYNIYFNKPIFSAE